MLEKSWLLWTGKNRAHIPQALTYICTIVWSVVPVGKKGLCSKSAHKWDSVLHMQQAWYTGHMPAALVGSSSSCQAVTLVFMADSWRHCHRVTSVGKSMPSSPSISRYEIGKTKQKNLYDLMIVKSWKGISSAQEYHFWRNWVLPEAGQPQLLRAICASPHSPHREEFLSYFRSNPALCQFKIVIPSPVTTGSGEKICTLTLYVYIHHL